MRSINFLLTLLTWFQVFLVGIFNTCTLFDNVFKRENVGKKVENENRDIKTLEHLLFLY